ncbi:MAG: protein of unknown function DUF35 [uncultured bacterium]|nr:MAG: protein of unknown function DUF35 [uncultured bacterium]
MCDCCCSSKESNKVKLNTTPAKIKSVGEFWVIDNPRFQGDVGTHHHTLGMLTPYFQGLTQGKLLGTKCTNPECPISHGKGELWLPPRADCPDCHKPMAWEEVKNPVGEIFTYTYVERGGQGLEIETPYYQIDVQIPGVATIVKSYLINRERQIKIGDKVKAGFRTGALATNTCLDLYWELI